MEILYYVQKKIWTSIPDAWFKHLHIKYAVVDTCRRHRVTQDTITWVVKVETFFTKMKGSLRVHSYICTTGKRKKIVTLVYNIQCFQSKCRQLRA